MLKDEPELEGKTNYPTQERRAAMRNFVPRERKVLC